MRIAVTGSAGFVGRHLVPRFVEAGHEVDTYDVASGGAANQMDGVRYDAVVHLAANVSNVARRMNGGVEAYRDLALDYWMADYVSRTRPSCYVYPSSCAVDWADDPYAWVKLTGERLAYALHGQGIRTVILRPFSGYGPDQSPEYPFRAILDRARAHEDPLTVWGTGSQVRDWIWIDDLVEAFVWALEAAPPGVPIDIGTGRPVSIRLLAELIAEAVGYRPAIEADSTKAESSPHRVADTRLAALYGYEAKTTLEDGIRKAVETVCQPTL